MSTPEPQPYPWLPIEKVLAHVGVKPDSPEYTRNSASIEDARQAAAEYIQDNQAGRWVYVADADGILTRDHFDASPRHVQAGVLAAGRLYARRGSLVGVATYGEFATQILRYDPDVTMLLGLGRNAKPAVG